MNAINARKLGFNLIEVNLAIFLVAGGLLVLFSLFPFGLRQSQAASDDSLEAMFADYVLSAVEANAMAEMDVDAWRNGRFPLPGNIQWQEGRNQPTLWPGGQDETYVMYSLGMKDADASGLLKTVVLTVKSGRYGRIDQFSRTYVTTIAYMGM